MRHTGRRLVVGLFLGLASLPTLIALPVLANSKDPAAQPAGEYALDPAHTSVTWRVNHLGFSFYTARFDKAQGSLTFDPADPTKSKLSVTIDPASVSTGLPKFDEDLRGAKWFDAKTHPAITFTATAITRTGPETGTITGDLTLKGVTKPVTLDAVFNGGGLFALTGKHIIGFGATGAISRSAFGITPYPGMVGDQVQIIIQAEFTRK